MKKTALILMLITVISKAFGFAREIALSYFYGTTNISDAFIVSLTIPSVIFSFIGAGITTGYIPIYSEIKQKDGERKCDRYTNNLVNSLLIICTILLTLGLIFTGQIVKIFASGFEGETLALAVRFTRIGLFGMYFTGLISVFKGFLQLNRNYVIPALVGFPLNFIIFLSIYLGTKSNILILAIGNVVAASSQLALMLPFVYKENYRFEFIVDLKDEYIRKMVYIALPVIVGVSVNQINVLVDKTLASGLAVGGISALNYANRLNGFVQGMFVETIATVMYPLISKMAAENNMDGLKKSVQEAISLINFLVVPTTLGAMIFAEPIVKLLFGRGSFDAYAIRLTSSALFYYSIGMLGFGLREVLSRAFYSLQDTKTPMVNAVIAVTMNIILNLILSKFLGIGGLALATSISAMFCTFLLFISLKKKIGPFGIKNMIITFAKVIVASLGMGVMARLSYNLLQEIISANLSLIASIAIGAIVYFVIIYFMKIDEVDTMMHAVKKKLKEVVNISV